MRNWRIDTPLQLSTWLTSSEPTRTSHPRESTRTDSVRSVQGGRKSGSVRGCVRFGNSPFGTYQPPVSRHVGPEVRRQAPRCHQTVGSSWTQWI